MSYSVEEVAEAMKMGAADGIRAASRETGVSASTISTWLRDGPPETRTPRKKIQVRLDEETRGLAVALQEKLGLRTLGELFDLAVVLLATEEDVSSEPAGEGS